MVASAEVVGLGVDGVVVSLSVVLLLVELVVVCWHWECWVCVVCWWVG